MSRPHSFLSKLAKGIHPPLLTTPKDSERLLASLQRSFKKQLDKEHPLRENSERRPIDSHVNAIVTNPLFVHAVKPTPESPIVSPNNHFSNEVATGNATLKIATQCLNRARALTMALENAESAKDRVILTRSVLRWLWSSGLDDSMEFAYDRMFVRSLLQTMDSESRLRYASKWLHKLSTVTLTKYKNPSAIPQDLIAPMSQFFWAMAFPHGIQRIGNTIAGENVQFRIEEFQRAIRGLPKDLVGTARQRVLHASMLRLFLDLLEKDSTIALETSIYDTFAEMLQKTSNHALISPVLRLAHPTKPDPDAAIVYLENYGDSPTRNTNSLKQSVLLALAAGTLELLTSRGETLKAQQLLYNLQTTLFGVPRQQPAPVERFIPEQALPV